VLRAAPASSPRWELPPHTGPALSGACHNGFSRPHLRRRHASGLWPGGTLVQRWSGPASVFCDRGAARTSPTPSRGCRQGPLWLARRGTKMQPNSVRTGREWEAYLVAKLHRGKIGALCHEHRQSTRRCTTVLGNLPSRSGDFHLASLTEPDKILSHHPARANARRLPSSLVRRALPGEPVGPNQRR
jgi:hypothetical protein